MVRCAVIAAAGLTLALAACGGEASAPSPPGARPTRGAPSPTPAGASRLGLTRRLPAAYRSVCDEQASRAPAGARVCPPLVPTGPATVAFAGPFSRQERLEDGFSADFASDSLDELAGRRVETNGGHWHYDVAWSPAVARAVEGAVRRPANAARPSSCRDLQLGARPVQACRVVSYRRGGGLHGEHIAYVWRHAGAAFVLSVHGYRNEPRVRAMAEAWIAELRR